MEDIDLKIKSLWIGKELSPIELLSINSYLQNGHVLELYVYDRVGNIPQGVELKDAEQIIPKSEVFSITLGKHKNTFSMFSNYFRYTLLYELGGWWSDLDIVCLKHYDFKQEYVFSRERTRDQKETVGSGIFKCPKSSQVMKYCKEAAQGMFLNKEELFWGKAGPILLNDAVTLHNLRDYSVPPDCFSPLGYFEIYKIFSEIKLPETSYALHVYNSSWMVQKYPRYGFFKINSLFEVLKRRYGVKNNLLGFVRELINDMKNNDLHSGFDTVKKKIRYGYHLL
jgi:Glycosyltransferase sugar-binding region containing DXD motif.